MFAIQVEAAISGTKSLARGWTTIRALLRNDSIPDAARGTRQVQVHSFVDKGTGTAVQQVVPTDGFGLAQVDPRLKERRGASVEVLN